MPTLLFIRGSPGSGKITAARILERDLGWRLFWLHDLDGISRTVGHGRDGNLARLMDEMTAPVLRHLMRDGKDLIYVRPARDRETVELALDLAACAGYRFVLATLVAKYSTLCSRVESRPFVPGRISSRLELDEYLSSRPLLEINTGLVVETDGKTPEEVAEEIKGNLAGSARAETA